jgi:hypothetical protein
MAAKGYLVIGLMGFGAVFFGCASTDEGCIANKPCQCGVAISYTTCVNGKPICFCGVLNAGTSGSTIQTGLGGAVAQAGQGGTRVTGKGGAKAGAGGSTKPVTGGSKAGAGAAGSAGSAGSAGKTNTNAVSGTTPASLPTAKETCPPLVSGNMTFLGSTVTMTVGPAGKKGPMVFYWHGTAMTSAEAGQGLGQAALADVQANGGVIASFTTTNSQGTNTGDMVWYTGDFDTADEILACAIEQDLIDITHIHSAGYSAGALQTGAMIFTKGYLASVLCYSGGVIFPGQLPDPSNVPSMIGAHGPSGTDTFIMNLGQSTIDLETTMKGLGGFVIDCQDTGDHVVGFGARTAVGPAAWQFFKDHPFKNSKPYASGLPASNKFPDYCKIVN